MHLIEKKRPAAHPVVDTSVQLRINTQASTTVELVAKSRALQEEFQRQVARFQSLMEQRTHRMAMSYAAGTYPTPLEKQPWLQTLVSALEREGYVSRDHDGRIRITIDTRGGGIRHCDIEGVVPLS